MCSGKNRMEHKCKPKRFKKKKKHPNHRFKIDFVAVA